MVICVICMKWQISNAIENEKVVIRLSRHNVDHAVVIAKETYKNIASYIKNSSLSWKYGWGQASNLLFIDQMTRTGFSYTSDERDIRHNEHDFVGCSIRRQVEFQIDLIPDVAPVARPPYRLAPSNKKELSDQLKELFDKGFKGQFLTLGSSGLVCQEEGLIVLNVHRLPRAEQANGEESLSTPKD
ncbi:putative reverse transcriptase domain-containing protein [Tanacetum coccineum]